MTGSTQEAALPPPTPLAPPPPAEAARTAEAATPTPASAPAQGECRPYTADTTLTGRNLPVQGMACRSSDGQWRLVSEVPQR